MKNGKIDENAREKLKNETNIIKAKNEEGKLLYHQIRNAMNVNWVCCFMWDASKNEMDAKKLNEVLWWTALKAQLSTHHPSPTTHTKQFPIISHFCGCFLLRFGSRFLPVHSNGQCGWEQILIVFICYAYWRDHSSHWKFELMKFLVLLSFRFSFYNIHNKNSLRAFPRIKWKNLREKRSLLKSQSVFMNQISIIAEVFKSIAFPRVCWFFIASWIQIDILT